MAVKSDKLQQLTFASDDVQHIVKLTLVDSELAQSQSSRQEWVHGLR